MKIILPLFLLLSNLTFGQNYVIDLDSKIYDLPNGEFLTAKLINNKTHLKHYNMGGNIIWEDSLSFQLPLDTVGFNWISKFHNTNDYIISMSRNLSLGWFNQSQNDTLIYQFTKLNLTNHTFTSQFIDTFITKGIHPLEFKDTSLYLFSNDFTIDNTPFNQKTYSLNENMELSLIAPLDSVIIFPSNWIYFTYNNLIYKRQQVQASVQMQKFTPQMSKLSDTSINLSIALLNNNMIYYSSPLAEDSLLVISENINNNFNSTNKWRFTWTDFDLNIINSTIVNAPNIPDNSGSYIMSFKSIEIDKINKRIYILAREEYQSAYIYGHQRIFVFDFSFNLICDKPMLIGTPVRNQLIKLNNLVYLKNDNSQVLNLIKMECSTLNTEEAYVNDIDIFPNPTKSTLNLPNPKSKQIEVTLLNLKGEKLSKTTSSQKNIVIELETLQAGVYFVSISDGETIVTKRIIKE